MFETIVSGYVVYKIITIIFLYQQAKKVWKCRKALTLATILTFKIEPGDKKKIGRRKTKAK